jgi:hypothetical protein
MVMSYWAKSFRGWGYCPNTLCGGPEEFFGGENIMMIVLGNFLIAAAAVIAASAIIGFFLTNLLIWVASEVDRSISLCRGKVPAFCAAVAIRIRSVLSSTNHILRDQRDFSGLLTHCRMRMIMAAGGLTIVQRIFRSGIP